MKCLECFLVVILCGAGLGEKLPPEFRVCSQKQPGCLKDAVQDALPKLKNGIASLKVPPLEPLTIPSVTIGEGKGPVNVAQNYENMKIYGISTCIIETLSWNFTETEFTTSIVTSIPESRMEADYELNGRVLLLPISGKGKCKILLKDVKSKVDFRAVVHEKKGTRHLKVEDFKIQLDPGKVNYEFQHLFNGDEKLGQEINNVLNDNWKEIFDDVKSGYEEMFGAVCKDFSNKIFNKVPLDEMFLDQLL